MPDKLKTLVELVVLPALILAFFSVAVSAMGLSLKASWENGSVPSLADLNGDGSQEIISPFNYFSTYGIYLWHGNGTVFGSWPAYTPITVNDYPATGDINNDGEKEIVFTDQSGVLYVYHTNGTFIWSNDSCYQIGYMDSSPVLVDLDNDGNLDILVSCHDMGLMSSALYGFDSSGNFIGLWSPIYAFGDAYGSPVISDIEGDGHMEILVSGGGFGMPIFAQMFRADGTEAWLNPDVSLTTEQNLPFMIPPAIGDVDGDGTPEVILASYNDTISKIYLLNATDGVLENSWDVLSIDPPSSAVLGDMDGDGIPEMIIYWGDTVYAWNGTGSIIWSQNVGGFSTPTPSPAPAAADINNDTLHEVLVPAGKNILIFSNTGSLLLNKSFDDFPELSGFDYSLNTPAIGDVDGDNENEIVVGVNTLNRIYVFGLDIRPPSITIHEPQNTTYSSLSGLPLNYSVQDALSGVDSVWYSLDGQGNTTLFGNTTFNVSSYGSHSLTLYANDTSGNTGSSSIAFSVACTENWSCSDWSSCSGGTQSRTCMDANQCGTTQNKPPETQSCSSGGGGGGGGGGYYCITNWTCSDWSACQPGGVQTRNCTDRNNCIVAFQKPAEKQNCTYTAPAEVKLPCSGCSGDCGVCPAPSNQTEENATGGEVTGQIIGIPQALDIVLFLSIFVLGVVLIVSFALKKN